MQTVAWRNGVVELIDQTRLPHELVIVEIATVAEMVDAIKRLVVRGAPALGVAGAYGVVLAAAEADPDRDPDHFNQLIAALRTARPTAVNLAARIDELLASETRRSNDLLTAAHRIRDEEIRFSVAMGERGADLIGDLVDRPSLRIMTICNTGGLASVERGTALAVVQTLHERGRLEITYPLETRPLLQGARLTTWELGRMGAPYRLIVDSAGPALIGRGLVDVVVAGADRIAANGDTANKIGTLSLALAARHAAIPFLIVAPESTVDRRTGDGHGIDIELRSEAEVTGFGRDRVAPVEAAALNPAFDVTPAELITAIVTDRRVVGCSAGQRPDHE